MAISLPFVLTGTKVKDYVIQTKFTGAGRVTPSEPFWNFVASYYHHSIFWTFVPQECYESWPCLALKLRIAMLGLNIYHFFIRKWCWRQCFENLFKSSRKEEKENEERSENNFDPNKGKMDQN